MLNKTNIITLLAVLLGAVFVSPGVAGSVYAETIDLTVNKKPVVFDCESYIEQQALDYGLDPKLMLAIAEAESKCTTIKQYAEIKITNKWDNSEWKYFNKIISKESANWTVTGNHNLSLSSAFGLGGFLNATWKSVGCVKSEIKSVQVDCTIEYIEQRYGTPKKAWDFHIINNWY